MMMMKAVVMTLLALVHGGQVQVNPVQKVVALLEGMLEKGKKEKYDEQVQFAEFKEFCDEMIVQKEHAIGEETENIDHFTADIRKERANANVMKMDMAQLDRHISNLNGDMQAATKVRQMENADYDALQEDYSESVDALMKAISTIQKESHAHQQSGLVQISALQNLDLIPAKAKKAIDVFVQQSKDVNVLLDLAASAPEANAYEFQSAGIVKMLKKLLEKFMDERRGIEKEEVASKSAYDTLIKDLEDQIAEATDRREWKSGNRAKQLEMKAEDKGERKDEVSLKSSDTKYKTDLEATCKQKTSDFESRQKLRAKEIETLEKAIQIISGGAVAGSRNKHAAAMDPALVQKKGSAFPQLRSSSNSWNPVATYLQEEAVKMNSRVLAAIALRAAKDPFIKVKKMIEELLHRLQAQASEEVEHKGWCDEELATNKATRREKTDAVETLHAEVDQLQASIAKLTEEIHELDKAVAELDSAMATQTRLRAEEKAKNTETISDAKKAQVAVQQAIDVLREFYVEAADATAFVQKNATEVVEKSVTGSVKKNATVFMEKSAAPEIFDDSYKGMGDENEGVLGMLEVILTDFARLESATKSAEVTGQREYDQFMTDSQADKATKTGDLEHHDEQKQRQEGALTRKNTDLDATQKQLDGALVYFDKLKPSCVDAGVDFEDRVLQRKEEMRALKRALDILNGEDI